MAGLKEVARRFTGLVRGSTPRVSDGEPSRTVDAPGPVAPPSGSVVFDVAADRAELKEPLTVGEDEAPPVANGGLAELVERLKEVVRKTPEPPRPYGRGRRKVQPSNQPPSAAGSGSVAGSEIPEELRGEVSLDGVEARAKDLGGRKPARRKGSELSEEKRAEIISKIPQIRDEELEAIRNWSNQVITEYMEKLPNDADIEYTGSRTLASIAIFIAQASRRDLANFDPQSRLFKAHQVKRALGICLLFMKSHPEIANLAGLFNVTKGAVEQKPLYFWGQRRQL